MTGREARPVDPEDRAAVFAAIDAWHESDTGEPLHAWLGWTSDAYAAWVEGRQPGEPSA